MPITHLFAGIPTADFDSALAWWERLLGRPPDRFPTEDEAVWQVADAGLIYLVADAERAGNALVTLIVDDLEEHVCDLAERGIGLAEIETLPGVVRKTRITDPDGNSITVGQLGQRYWEHLGGGAGFFNTMRIYPDLGLGLVAMGNCTSWNHRQLADAVTQAD